MSQILKFVSAINCPDLVGPSITSLLQNWDGKTPVEAIQVAEIDPATAGGQNFCERYGVPFNEGANCVIIEGIRNKQRTLAACVTLVGTQTDFNGIVRKHLNARRVSLAPLELVLKETNMEYGSITPFGLPSSWPILIDEQVMSKSKIVIGSGILKSKLQLPTTALAELKGAVIIEGLATSAP